MKHILIIEDDQTIREELSLILQNNGYTISVLTDFLNIPAKVKELIPDLILLDINLPGMDGFLICSQIRSFSAVPIIYVTSRNTDMDELKSITLGGDDFITKPYNIPILLARITSLLKRTYQSSPPDILCHNGALLHLDSSVLEWNGKTAELTKNEGKIMTYLFKNPDKIIPRIDLVEYLWDNQLYIDDNTLSVNITRIRAKMEEIGLLNFIRTKHRQGYII